MQQARTLASVLCILNDVRGGDSWGFAGDKTFGRRYQTVKGLGDAAFMKSSNTHLMADCRWLIGHTRKATTGGVCVANSHPFVIGEVVGAHNGMVTNHQELNAKYGRECEVDSQHVFHHVDDGVDSFADVQAYGAIAFATLPSPDEVFLGRFNDGELALARVDGFGLVWSSSRKHLRCALKAADLKGRDVHLEEGKCYVASPTGTSRVQLELDFADPWRQWVKYDLMKKTGSCIVDDDEEEPRWWSDALTGFPEDDDKRM